jgi:hypothetical protein
MIVFLVYCGRGQDIRDEEWRWWKRRRWIWIWMWMWIYLMIYDLDFDYGFASESDSSYGLVNMAECSFFFFVYRIPVLHD